MATEPASIKTTRAAKDRSRNTQNLRIDTPESRLPESLFAVATPDTSTQIVTPFFVDKPLMTPRSRKKPRTLDALKNFFDVGWITCNFSLTRFKPVIRCTVAAWISLLFLIIPKLENAMGQVH